MRQRGLKGTDQEVLLISDVKKKIGVKFKGKLILIQFCCVSLIAFYFEQNSLTFFLIN